jgi:hypothetical protein
VNRPKVVKRTTWTAVWRPSRVTGASIPLRADLDRMVLRMAHEEWKSTVSATLVRDGGADSTGTGCGSPMAGVEDEDDEEEVMVAV